MHYGKFIDMRTVHERLIEARKSAGYANARDAAEAMGVPYPTYAGHENGSAGIRATVAERYARKFKVSLEWLLTERGPMKANGERMASIQGLAGAGPEGSVLFATGDGNFGEVPAPVGSGPDVTALEVRGTSMRGLAEDGWIIFYEERGAPSEEHIGEPCVCWLEDGRVLIKTPYRGSSPGLFHLESTNAPLMRDVAVREMAEITDIKTRRAARRFVRQNPEQELEDIQVAKRYI